MISDIPEELLDIFPGDGEPGSKRPKDQACISSPLKWLKIVSEHLYGSAVLSVIMHWIHYDNLFS